MKGTPETLTFSLADYDFALPEELIAQEPIELRDAARLLIVRRQEQSLAHQVFRDLPSLLEPEDLLVINDSRVLPARLYGQRETGGKVEILLVQPRESLPDASQSPRASAIPTVWLALARPARRLRRGERLSLLPHRSDFPPQSVTVLDRQSAGQVVVELSPLIVEQLHAFGHVPLPPYIRKALADPERYQTVYATAPGSVAAPTAGLHFTNELLSRLRQRGIRVVRLTLHVGIGTFKPIATPDIRHHQMHAEWYRVPAETVQALVEAKRAGRRVIAVGTTSARTVESIAELLKQEPTTELTGWTQLFIYPGYRWQVVDGLITNFHLPRSTLILLVASFAGRDLTLRAYREAIERRYRFYSFGDAMLIL